MRKKYHSWFGEKSNESKLLLTSKILLAIPHCDNSPLKDADLVTLKYSDLLQAIYMCILINSY